MLHCHKNFYIRFVVKKIFFYLFIFEHRTYVTIKEYIQEKKMKHAIISTNSIRICKS